MQLKKICPLCQGEGELRIPQYGQIQRGVWALEMCWSAAVEGGENFRALGPCRPCGGTGYMQILKGP